MLSTIKLKLGIDPLSNPSLAEFLTQFSGSRERCLSVLDDRTMINRSDSEFLFGNKEFIVRLHHKNRSQSESYIVDPENEENYVRLILVEIESNHLKRNLLFRIDHLFSERKNDIPN